MIRILAISIILTFANCLQLVGQDAQFTQFYASPTLLSPSFAGTSVQSRVVSTYRNQWTAIPKGFVTYAIAYDQYFQSIHSGIGLNITHDRAGSGALRNSRVALQYSYEVRINKDLFLRPALELALIQTGVNFNDLIFGDQLINQQNSVESARPGSVEETTFQPEKRFDIGTGLLAISKKYWLGVSAKHLNTPNESLLDAESIIPIKVSAHGGYRFRVKGFGYNYDKHDLVVAAHYKSQGLFDQLDLGCYYEPGPMVFGLWYRGLAFKGNGQGTINQDALALLLGFHEGRFRIGYSYDITISRLGVGTSAGSHEMTINYEWASKKNKRLARKRIIPCAKF